MIEEEAKEHGIALAKVVSLTHLLDEMKDIDSQKYDKKKLDQWFDEPIAEGEDIVEDGSEDSLLVEDPTKPEFKKINEVAPSLNAESAAYAVNFVKERRAKIEKRHHVAPETYEKNDVLPADIPVEIYLESLKSLKSQKEHRKVDLFKEFRERKTFRRRDASYRKTVIRLKKDDDERSAGDHTRTSRKSNTTPNRTSKKSRSGAVFETDATTPKSDTCTPRRRNKHRVSKTLFKHGQVTPPAPNISGKPFNNRPMPNIDDLNDFNYQKKLETTISDMILQHDRNVAASEPFPIESYPYGTPILSRPLCRIYSSNK